MARRFTLDDVVEKFRQILEEDSVQISSRTQEVSISSGDNSALIKRLTNNLTTSNIHINR